MEVVTASNWHDGSLCFLENGQVKRHVIAERVNHGKHSEICDKSIEYFGKDLRSGFFSKLEDSHHLFHAAHSFYDSGFRRALCIVIDGMGCNVPLGLQETKQGEYFLENSVGRESMSAYLMEYPHQFYLAYREVSVPFECDGFVEENNTRVINKVSPAMMFEVTCKGMGMEWYDAGKLMAMASYGKSGDIDEDVFVINNRTLHDITMTRELNSFEEKCDFGRSLQEYCQNRVKDFILKSIKETGCKNVCMSGGYFLNCVSNTYIHKSLPLDVNTFIEPICGDDGISIGLAKLRWYELTRSKKSFPLKTIYYGKRQEINVDGKKVTPHDVAQLLADRKVIGIFQSRSESGPRALGNRSILYDPRDPNGRNKINKLKGREDYRPLAATVLHEHAHKWFDMCNLKESPYMLYTLDVLSDEVPAICHVDNTCRVQTLKKSFNEHYYNLIKEFKNITGIPLVLNTSLNLAGDTIAETVEDAMKTLNGSEMDYLYFPEKGILVASSQTGT